MLWNWVELNPFTADKQIELKQMEYIKLRIIERFIKFAKKIEGVGWGGMGEDEGNDTWNKLRLIWSVELIGLNLSVRMYRPSWYKIADRGRFNLTRRLDTQIFPCLLLKILILTLFRYQSLAMKFELYISLEATSLAFSSAFISRLSSIYSTHSNWLRFILMNRLIVCRCVVRSMVDWRLGWFPWIWTCFGGSDDGCSHQRHSLGSEYFWVYANVGWYCLVDTSSRYFVALLVNSQATWDHPFTVDWWCLRDLMCLPRKSSLFLLLFAWRLRSSMHRTGSQGPWRFYSLQA